MTWIKSITPFIKRFSLSVAVVLSISTTAYSEELGEPEKEELKFGFIKLTDMAPIAIAYENGYFEDEGLYVTLEAQANWKVLLDRVIDGQLDGAHMLAGQPLGATIGFGTQAHIITAFSMHLNGNGITVSNDIWKQMKKNIPHENGKPVHPIKADALKPVITEYKNSGKAFKMGMVFPVSTHNYELRYWMASSGIKPDQDCTIKPFPPPTMPSNLIAGNIEGYCVGEPWNSRIVLKGKGSALVTNYDIWNNNPEKVLQARADFVEKYPETTKAVMKAVIEAQMWLDASWENREEAIGYLAKNNYVKAPKNVLRKSMSGTFLYNKGVDSSNPMFNVFANYYASYPYYSHGMWFITQMYRWGQLDKPVNMKETIEKVYRPDLFAEVAKEVGYTLPPSAWKKDGVDEYNKFIDGRVWDPNKAVDYIYDFDVTNAKVSKEDLLKANNWTVETKQPEYVCPYGPAGCADPKYITK